MTCPDVSFAIHNVAQIMGRPTSSHLEAAKHILCSLKGCSDTRHFVTGFCIFLGSNLITWCYKKQRTASWLSTEAKYRALVYGCADSIWIFGLLSELWVPIPRPIFL